MKAIFVRSALPAGADCWRYGRTSSNTAAHCYQFSGAVVAGNTVTLTQTDGLDGEDDMTAIRVTSDPDGPGFPGGVDGASVPTLSECSQILLLFLMMLGGMTQVRRRQGGQSFHFNR